MAAPAKTKLYSVSSLLMALLFAISASFQLNDIDWYLWIPLYAGGSVVNLLSCCCTTPNKSIKRMAKLSLSLGAFLFIKLCFAGDTMWSLDMRERAIREKLGSGLVFVSMILQLAASSLHHFHIRSCVYFVMRLALITAISLVFLVLFTGSMIMHSASSSVQDDSTPTWQSKLVYYVDSGTLLLIGNYCLFFLLVQFFFPCMILKPPKSRAPTFNQKNRLQASIGYGMAALVGISYGLSLVFHLYHKDEMKF